MARDKTMLSLFEDGWYGICVFSDSRGLNMMLSVGGDFSKLVTLSDEQAAALARKIDDHLVKSDGKPRPRDKKRGYCGGIDE